MTGSSINDIEPLKGKRVSVPKAIIVGASSGIGRALAKVLVGNGYTVGLTARRLPLLEELQKELGNGALIRQMDVSDPSGAVSVFSGLIEDIGGVDLVVISAGTGHLNPDLDWDKERETINVNVAGFTAIATAAMQLFVQQGSGHLANLSSIAALRGGRQAPAYNASKAYGSIYIEGLRQKVRRMHLPITLTDIQLGYVNTSMAQGTGYFGWQHRRKQPSRYMMRSRRKRNGLMSRRGGVWLHGSLGICPIISMTGCESRCATHGTSGRIRNTA